jgi:hypothetical protein
MSPPEPVKGVFMKVYEAISRVDQKNLEKNSGALKAKNPAR